MLLVVSGCSVVKQPPYQRPALPEKEVWKAAPSRNEKAALRLEWWRNFGDPALDMLVNSAIAHNLDIRIATARVQAAEAALQGSRGRRLPVINLDGRASRRESFGDRDRVSGQYSLQGRLNWELDIWGRLKKGIDANVAAQASTQAARRAVWLKVTATVARTYFDLRRLDEQIGLRQSSIDATRKSLDVFQARLAAGFATQVEVDSQAAELNRLKRELLELRRRRQLRENHLATLLGKPAGKLAIPPGGLRNIVHPVDIPVGLPSQLVARRPDIVEAEYRVLRAYHLLGQARLAKLPSFSLTGNSGYASPIFSRLLNNWTLGLASLISIPLFDPAVKARIAGSEARMEFEKARYRRTVLTAFEEVENALTSLENRKRQHQLLRAREKTLETVAEKRRGQLAEGLISQLDLFEAERSLLEASQALLDNYQAILGETVTLYESLGGGWAEQTVAREGGQ